MYLGDPKLVVTPAYYEGGVPVFTPTMKQFEDFYKFNKAINQYGMQSGIVKVIPPAEWRLLLSDNYSDDNLERVRVKNPIVQHINSPESGVFTLQNVERARTYSMAQWLELSKKQNHQPPRTRRKPQAKPSDVPEGSMKYRLRNPVPAYNIDTSEFDADRCAELEKVYWKSLVYAEPMYGADVMGLLFTDAHQTWNVARLPNILNLMDAKLPGVNAAYLYAGLWKATFSWHLEDQDLYSINYLHFGAPKQWYLIPQKHADKFYDLMKETFPEDYKNCPEFLRHKTFLLSPLLLEKKGIQCNKIVHNEGEFMITYPYGYHAGFNYGYNLAESVNFALDDWFPFAEKTRKCECISDSVGINVRQLWCAYKGLPYDVPGLAADQGELTEEEVFQPAQECLQQVHRKERKPRKRRLPLCDSQCVLCPTTLTSKLLETPQFALIPMEGGFCHTACAQLLGLLQNGTISTEHVKHPGLRCGVCEVGTKGSKKPVPHLGLCVACDHPKCGRSFHVTCGLGAGVLYADGKTYCRYHRNKVSKLNAVNAQAVGVGSLAQFTLAKPAQSSAIINKEILCGYVTHVNESEQLLQLLVYPQLEDSLEVRYSDIIMGLDPRGDNAMFHVRSRKRSLVLDYEAPIPTSNYAHLPTKESVPLVTLGTEPRFRAGSTPLKRVSIAEMIH